MKMTRFLVTLLFVWVCFLSYGQKHEWKENKTGAFPYRYVTNDPTQTRFYTLKNGLTVILSANNIEPRIAFRMAVRAGSDNDPSNHTGLAHYLEHILFKGTEKYGTLDWQKEQGYLTQIESLFEKYNATTDSAERKSIYKTIDQVSNEASKYSIANEYPAMMAGLGSQGTNAHTWLEETVYEEDIPSNAIDPFLAIQAERFRDPVIRLFHTELEAVYEEKNRGLDNDDTKMMEAMFTNVFPTHHYGTQSTIGTIEHLKNPSITAIKNFYNQYYVPNNMAIIMSGDFNPDELIKKIDAQFSYMVQKPVNEYKGPVEAPIQGPITKNIYGPSQESVRIVYRAPAAGTRDAMLCNLMGNILFNGKAGLIDVNLVQQQKLLGAQAGVWQFKDYGLFLLVGMAKEGQSLEEDKDLLMSQIKILKEGKFDESLIKATAANYKLGQMQALQSNASRVQDMMTQFIQNKGAQWNENVAYIEDMQKISKKELVEFANNFFKEDNYVVLYKRKGEDKNIVKVEKPAISPVETNAGKVSPFVQMILSSQLKPLQPVFLDYNKDLVKSKSGIADILYVPNKKNDLFTLTYHFNMGTWNNRSLSIAVDYLNYLNTNKYTAEQISKKFYELACNFSIQAGREETDIVISGLKENFEDAVKLFENLLTECLPDENALEALKNDTYRSRENYKMDKRTIGEAQRTFALYGSKNPFNYVLSNEEIKNLKSSDLISLLHSLNSYQHLITYYGPETVTELQAKLKRLHALPLAWKAYPAAVKFERINQTKSSVLFTNYDAVQAEVFWVRNLENYDPQKEALVSLYSNYFGGGLGSIVFKTIRESRALAYSTYAGVSTPVKKDDRFFMRAYVGTQADKLDSAVTAMNGLFKEMPSVQQNFELSRQNMLKEIETERIIQDGIIDNYLGAKRKGLDHDIRIDKYKKYQTLQMSDLYNYHQSHFANVPFTYCVIASDKKINVDDLKKLGDLKLLTLDELFGF